MFEKLKIGQLYSKQILSSLLNEVSLKTVREGIFYCKNSDSTLFLLIWKNKINLVNFISTIISTKTYFI